MNPFRFKLQKISLHKTTLLFIVLALIGNVIGYKRSLDIGMLYASVFQTFLIVVAFGFFSIRNVFCSKKLVSIIMILMILYGIIGMIFYGFSASGKFLLFLGPLLFSEFISFRKNIFFFIAGVVAYVLTVVLILNNVISVKIDHNIYTEKTYSWIVDGLSLFIISFSGLVIKLSSKKVSEGYLKEIENSDKRFQQMFKNSNEAIVLLKDYVVYDCNQKVLDLFGCEESYILNTHISFHSSPVFRDYVLDDLLLERLTLEIKYERVKMFEWEYKRATGELFILEVHLVNVNIMEGEGHYMQAVLRDVTEKRNKELAQLKYQKVLEEQVEQRTKELKELNLNLIKANTALKVKHTELSNTIVDLNYARSHLIQSEKMASIGVLTAGVAHEINNPLNFIQTGIYSLENILENGHLMGSEEEVLKTKYRVLEQMNVGVHRVSTIVRSLNRFSRTSDAASERCDINEVIQNCLLILNHESKDKCKVLTDFSIEKPLVIGDEGKLHQVFINVIHNAIQSIEGFGVIEVTTRMNALKTKIIVHVRDEGCGIDPESLKKVFDPFFTTKRAEKGTGLGLAIVYNIIQEQKANVRIKSVLGEGTTVSFVFLGTVVQDKLKS